MLNLREQLCATPASHALLTTYALSPTLFESQIIRPLLDSRCDEILLLVDRDGYDALLTERAALAHAGCSYWIGCVDLFPRAFHPKVALLWSEDAATAFVMSANFTRGGLATNVEIVDRLTWSRDTGGDIGEVSNVAAWFRRLGGSLPIPAAIATTIDRMLVGFPTDRTAGRDTEARFIHNLDVSIFDQVMLDPPANTTEILVMSPFHERRLGPIAAMAELFPDARITVAQGDLDGTIDPAAVPASLKRRITTALCSTRDRQRRAWHAKAVVLQSAEQSSFFAGSANCTRPGFLESFAGGGNVEAGILRRLASSDDVARVLGQIKLKKVPLDKLRCRVTESSRQPPGPAIEWAEISASTLTIDLVGVDPSDPQCVGRLALLTARGRRSVQVANRRFDTDGVQLVCTLDHTIEESFGAPMVLEVDVRPSRRSAYVTVRSVVMCPDEIRLPTSVKRVREAMRALERGDARTGDVRDVVSFVQETLANLLVHTGRTVSLRPSAHRTSTDETSPDTPGVILADDHAIAALAFHATGISTVGNVLSALPSIFRRLLEEPVPALERGTWAVSGGEGDSGEEAFDDPAEEESADDGEELEEDAAAFVEWAVAAFENDSSSEVAALYQWPTYAYLVEFLLLFTRYMHRRAVGTDTEPSAFSSYRARSRAMLTGAFSTAGRAWGKPTGWFVRTQLLLGPACPRPRSALIARIAHRVAELYADAGRTSDASWLRHVLDGVDRFAASDGQGCERAADVLTQLQEIVIESQQPSDADGVVHALAAVRGQETTETVAVTKFRLLLRLQDARMQLVGLIGAAGVPSSNASGQEIDAYREIEQDCLKAFADDTKLYLQSAPRHRGKAFVHLEDGRPNCPRCRLGIPAQRAADLRILTKITQCPNCFSLIIPLPSAACPRDR